MLLEIGRVNASSKTELRHRIRKLEIPHFMMNSRLGQMAALLGALGGGGLLDDPDQKQSVIKEAREACNRPIEYRNRYEGKSMFRLTLHQDVLGHPAALIAGFVEYINTRNALVREQIGSNLALPITSVKYYLPPAVNPSDDKKK
jgi:hypothetical protein